MYVFLQRRLAKKWSTFYNTGASHLDVFLPVIQFPWLVLNNATEIPPNKPLARCAVCACVNTLVCLNKSWI